MRRQFTLLYDGECPICRREVDWLKRRDRNGRLALEDIAALGFDPAKHGLTREEVSRVLHGVRYDGKVVRGMEAVREAYQAVGLGWLLAPTRLPGVRALSDAFYRWFARNRLTLGRVLETTCSGGQCSVPSVRQKRLG